MFEDKLKKCIRNVQGISTSKMAGARVHDIRKPQSPHVRYISRNVNVNNNVVALDSIRRRVKINDNL